MPNFTTEEQQSLASADEVHVSFREGQRIPIWIVVDGGHVYIRSVKGPAGKWYQALAAGRAFWLFGPQGEWAINGEHVTDAGENERVTAALNRKYLERWPGPTAAMVRPEVLETTFRIQPA